MQISVQGQIEAQIEAANKFLANQISVSQKIEFDFEHTK